jgi:cytidine deaminase
MELSHHDADLYESARTAAAGAYAPYSGFAVGAALRAADGTVYCAVNVENASYGLTSCAERNALFAAVSAGSRDLESIAIHADAATVPPCGACRQVLAELAPELRVIWRRAGVLVVSSLAELLPERFSL